jgi:transcriptional regulator with XRE-family HTH domain
VFEADQRVRIGTGLRRRRASLGLKQRDIAQKADIHVGTVQGIEYGGRKVSREKIEAYAKVVGTTIEELLNPDAVPPQDLIRHGLNREHLDIARRYKDGFRSVRDTVEMLLPNDPTDAESMADLANLILAIKRATDHDLAVMGAIEVLLDDPALMIALARRMAADPDALRELLDKTTKPK